MKTQRVDAKQIEHIVNTYSDMIIRIALHYTADKYDAEDIAQDVFLSLMGRNLSSLSESSLKAYIIRSTINKCKDYYRNKSRRKVISIDELKEAASPENESILEEVRLLPPKYRDIIYLHYYEGYTLNQIGKILKINPNTAGTRLKRAREKLKSILKEDNHE